MARLNTNDELWTAVSQGGVIRDVSAGESDTLNAAVSAGATSLTEATGTNAWAAGDLLRIESGGDAEVAVVEAYSTPTITLASQIAFDHPIGGAIVEQEKIDLGAISDDGVNRENAVEKTEIRASTQAGIYATLVTSVTGRISWNLLNHSMENVMISLGMDEANIHGAGTAVDPTIADLIFDDVGSLQNHALYFTGALKNGAVFQIEAWGADIDGNQTVTYLRGQQVVLPFSADVKHFRYTTPITVPV
jgi:hypothetical protein